MDTTTIALYGAGLLVLAFGVVSPIYPRCGVEVQCAGPALRPHGGHARAGNIKERNDAFLDHPCSKSFGRPGLIFTRSYKYVRPRLDACCTWSAPGRRRETQVAPCYLNLMYFEGGASVVLILLSFVFP